MYLWDEEPGLHLLTVAEFDMLPNGFVLTCIDGEECTKGVGYIDLDTRFGYLAYGVIDPANHPESELLLRIKLACAG